MVSGYPTSTNLPQVDGLSTDPRDLGHHTSRVNLGYVWFSKSLREIVRKRGRKEKKGNKNKNKSNVLFLFTSNSFYLFSFVIIKIK